MTTIRIAYAEPRPGKLPDGGFDTRGYLIVLADDAKHRAVPVWITEAGDLAHLLHRPVDALTDSVPQELATRLLGAARARVTGVDVDVTEAGVTELSPDVTVARVGLAAPDGNRQVIADLGLGLALAVATGSPVRLADAVLDRLAVPVPGDDLLTPFLDRVPPAARPQPDSPPVRRPPTSPSRRPRYEPRNLDFARGLAWWDLDSGPGSGRPGGEPDYTATTEGPAAVLSSVEPRPAGSATLIQTIYADDYRGTAVTFSGEISGDLLSGQAGLRLEILRYPGEAHEDYSLTVSGRDWTRHEISVQVPGDANLIQFGIALDGLGRVALRHPDLRQAGPDVGAP